MFCSCGPNLVILAWTRDKLSRGQASGYRTHRRTDRQTQPTTIPEGQNWPRVIKWLTSNIRQNRNNFHLMWESTIATISSWASTAWAVFPRPVCVTIRTNLIGLPLLRVVNNFDRWMRKAWEWREASHVVRTRFGTRLSAIDYAAVRTAQQFRKLCCQ